MKTTSYIVTFLNRDMMDSETLGKARAELNALNSIAEIVEAIRDDLTSRSVIRSGESDIKDEAKIKDAARFYDSEIHKNCLKLDEALESLSQLRKAKEGK